jgi:L-alanine-DL-glutamate epimerase-like enolase superfamily enzyme
VLEAIAAQLAAFRRGAGPDMDVRVDLNFHYKTERFLKVARAMEPLVAESLKIAAMADTYEVNVAPHNFYGHLRLPTGPGWGTEVDEAAVRAHPPRASR